ncbi:MAG: glycosyltransferase family protein [Candidatus Micrarchaeaceae archaeon]
MVGKLTILIFSRDDIEKAVGLIESVYDIADDIVIMDSSSNAQHGRLLAAKQKLHLKKLKVFHVVALGYADPLRMYALKKCKNGWILMLDTDERISPGLKSGIRGLIGNARCSAFSMKRYEDVGADVRGAYANWQIRLFRKGAVSFRGIIHEEPKVKGRLEKLDGSRYFIDHVNELKGSSGVQYGIMEKFLRMSYRSFNERVIESFYKVTMPGRRNRAGSFGMSLKALLLAYEKLGGKREEDEISGFDYFLFYYLYYFSVYVKMRRIDCIMAAYRAARYLSGQSMGWREEPDGDENFGISKELYRIGLIRFLELDMESTVLRLNRTYGKRGGGISLLISLLRLRYEKGRRWLD